jgi:hypothetical protein
MSDSQMWLIHQSATWLRKVSTARVADNVMLKNCLHGEEKIVFADRGYQQNNRTLEHFASEDGLSILVLSKKPNGRRTD